MLRLSRKYLAAMNDPLRLYEEEFERTKNSPFRCLQHGDVWHNNCLFKKSPENETKLALVDWQVTSFHILPLKRSFHIILERNSLK